MKSHGLGAHDENHEKIMAYFRRFCVKEPVIQKPFQKHSATFVVACVFRVRY